MSLSETGVSCCAGGHVSALVAGCELSAEGEESVETFSPIDNAECLIRTALATLVDDDEHWSGYLLTPRSASYSGKCLDGDTR